MGYSYRWFNILSKIKASGAELGLFGTPPKIIIKPTDVPVWVDVIKFSRLKELETLRMKVSNEIKDLEEYLPLVYADGKNLECAVIKSLRLMGLVTESAEPGFTADILAETKDNMKKFGFEVTGTTEAIKKESKKLTQLLEFERIKECNEKTILLTFA